MANSLTLVRQLGVDKAVTRVECSPGDVTALADAEGGHLPLFEDALLCKSEGAKSVTVTLGGTQLSPRVLEHLGFVSSLPSDCSVAQYLLRLGLTAQEVEEALDYFDLRRVSYLYCSQLTATAARQVEFMALLRSTASVFILKDPFQPFNGRWREEFAEKLLRLARDQNKIIVCTNIAFQPQCWTGQGSVKVLDVGLLAHQAIKQARGEAERLKAAQAAAKVEKVEEVKREERKDQGPTVQIRLPENLTYAYQHTRDFIFEPLANLSNFMRRFGLVGGVLGCAGLLALMGVILVPNLASKRMIIQAMHFNVSWQDIRSAMTDTSNASAAVQPQPAAPAAPVLEAPPADDLLPVESVVDSEAAPGGDLEEVAAPEVSSDAFVDARTDGENLMSLILSSDEEPELWCANAVIAD